MPKDLTDVSQWVDVSVPVGTDPATAASVEDPLQDLADRTRYLYDAISFGTSTKHVAIDACEMIPAGVGADDPWTSASSNAWYLDDDVAFGSPAPDSVGGLEWRMNFGAGSGPHGSRGLYAPIHVPDGATLVSASIGYHQSDSAAATHFLRAWLLRRGVQGHLVDMIGADNPPNNEQSTTGTNNTHTEDYKTGATAVVDNENYRYYIAIQQFHSGAGALSSADIYHVRTARVEYTIDEAPMVTP